VSVVEVVLVEVLLVDVVLVGVVVVVVEVVVVLEVVVVFDDDVVFDDVAGILAVVDVSFLVVGVPINAQEQYTLPVFVVTWGQCCKTFLYRIYKFL
jgi:hypothetical protein